jgi:uncharacterized membrane protein
MPSLANLHPIFVHFPVAFLTLYAVLEILSLPFLTRRTWWFPVKAVLLFAGFVGGLVALQTGELAAEAFRGTATMRAVQWHEYFAKASLIIFGILSAAYLVESLARKEGARWSDGQWWTTVLLWERRIFPMPVRIILAVCGFTALAITGALGGSLVYGTDVDPLAGYLYMILGLH